MSGAFPFARNADIVANAQGGFVGTIGTSIHGAEALFNAISRALQFPAYFGRNWDALDDCITDLSWLPSRVVLLHEATPHLSRKELVIYLRILKGALDVAAEDGRSLTIGFAERTRALEEAWAGVKA